MRARLLAAALAAAALVALAPAGAALGDGHHASPRAQQQGGTFPHAVECNGEREAYVRGSGQAVCLYPGSYGALAGLGADLSPAGEADAVHEVTIGVMAPVSGGAEGYGQDMRAGYMLALDDLNAELEAEGQPWRAEAAFYDTMTDWDASRAAVEALDARGIGVVAGPSIDTFGQGLIDYAGDRGMLLVSCCSEALSHRGAGDALMRMVPDHASRAWAFADVIASEGIEFVAPAGRDAEWTTDVITLTDERFVEAGGEIGEPVIYGADGAFDASHVEALAATVEAAAAERGADRVAVLYVGFEETFDFIEAAAGHGALGQVRWFGADANTILHDNEAGLEFAEAVGFASIQPADAGNRISESVRERAAADLGREPSVYAHLAYDTAGLIGRAMWDAQSSGPAAVRDAMLAGSAKYAGASGDGIIFDENGDRVSIDYAVYTREGGEWRETDRHKGGTAPEAMPAATLGLTAEEEAWLAENPEIVVAYDPQYAPIEYIRDGELAGLTGTYIDEFESLTGAEFVLSGVESWAEALEAVRMREADVIFMVAYSDDRTEYMSFTTPHTTVSTDVVTIGDGLDGADIADIRPVVIEGYQIEAWLADNRPDVEYGTVGSFAEGLDLMLAGEADALLETYEVVLFRANERGIEGVHNAGPTGHDYELRIGYDSDQPLLGSILQKAQDLVAPTATIPGR